MHDPEELLGCAAADPKRAVEVREILARVLDGSRFSEFKPLYGTQLVCGWGSIDGFPVGVLANNGILFSEESNKGAHFIQLANARDIPLLFVQNITGFMVGTRRRARRHHQGRREADQRRLQLGGAAPDADGRARPTARGTTACPGGPTTRGSSSPGPTTGSRSWAAPSSPA